MLYAFAEFREKDEVGQGLMLVVQFDTLFPCACTIKPQSNLCKSLFHMDDSIKYSLLVLVVPDTANVSIFIFVFLSFFWSCISLVLVALVCIPISLVVGLLAQWVYLEFGVPKQLFFVLQRESPWCS